MHEGHKPQCSDHCRRFLKRFLCAICVLVSYKRNANLIVLLIILYCGVTLCNINIEHLLYVYSIGFSAGNKDKINQSTEITIHQCNINVSFTIILQFDK